MGIATHPSHVTMPACTLPYPPLLTFLSSRFSTVTPAEWEQRIADGKVLDHEMRPVTLSTPYRPLKRLYYFREVSNETVIPFKEEILFLDDDLLVACKPHFLAVTPGGRYVDECLLNRLRKSTGIAELAPLHRIDRETAGLVMFSVNRKSCPKYGELFKTAQVEKTYRAVSASIPANGQQQWEISNRLIPGTPWFRMKETTGEINAKSSITLLDVSDSRAAFLLRPLTGKTHQLRIHMCSIGCGIMNDPLYPLLQPEAVDCFDSPLQLLAEMVRFRDPLSGKLREFVSQRQLISMPCR
jgi:tRNA pseudouridine32 synthase / 23S rRNA pseudouridine746 synthase